MGVTPIYGFPYPALTDSPNGPAQIQALAQAVETRVKTNSDTVDGLSATVGSLGLGQRLVVTNTTTVPGITTTETVTDQGSFTAAAGRRYLMIARFGAFSTVAADQIEAKIRWQAGATVTVAGTIVDSILEGFKGNGIRECFFLYGTTNSLPSGQVSVGITVVRGTGSGTLTRDGLGSMPSRLTVIDIGV